MPGLNLTRQEAEDRASLLHVESYDVELELTGGPSTFRSITTVSFDCTTPGVDTFIDAVTTNVHAIRLNGRAIDPDEASDGVRITIDGLAAHNTLVVDADYAYSITGEGLHRFEDPVDGQVYLYTQFEVPDARRVFAVFEQPDLKASFTFHVTVPDAWIVASNTPAPEPRAGDATGTHVWDFPPTQRISSYITAIVAGPYAVHRSELTSADGRTIPLGAFVRASLDQYFDADYIFDKTREGFAFYESLWDYPYPFEKYDQAFVPEYNAGAMENAGMVTFTESYVFRSKVTDAVRERRVVTILHELAHMWFGDLVTMRWWNDLWLNESFAEFISTLAVAEATEWHDAWATFASSEKSWAYRQDQLPSTHPIVAPIRDLEDVQVNFDGITYAKGASVLKQLVAYVGRDEFFAGIHNYFVKHAHGNTTLSDLLDELEATSGRDLKSWSGKWLETAGVNTLRTQVDLDSDGAIARLAVVQTAPEDHPTIRPHRVALGFYSITGSGLARVERIETDVDGAITEIPEAVGKRFPDLLLLNDDDLAYAKIRLDHASEQTAIAHLRDLHNPTARAVVWGALWDATRDAELRAGDFVTLVLDNIDAEDESTTLRTVLAQLRTSVSAYSAPSLRHDRQTHAADTLWQLAQNATAGSDAQFQFVRSFASLAITDQHFDVVEGLREGSLQLPGLEIDTDLDWELLQTLVRGARADEAEIDATLKRDNTASGNLAAATARASIPTAEHKAQTATALLTDQTLTNLTVRYAGFGLLHVNDPELLRPLVKLHFDHLLQVWSERSYHMAEQIIDATFPAPLADQALRDATHGWLDQHPDAAPALRRIVSENLDGVDRALAVQRHDAQN